MPGPKQNNKRKYPDANHQPCHKAADRKMRAEVRQEVYNELTLEQKIAALPPEPHAKKQRARLMALLAKRNSPKIESKENLSGESSPKQEQNKSKKYMKGN
jgi:hypothetical protein